MDEMACAWKEIVELGIRLPLVYTVGLREAVNVGMNRRRCPPLNT
jgi:hypothetical protein